MFSLQLFGFEWSQKLSVKLLFRKTHSLATAHLYRSSLEFFRFPVLPYEELCRDYPFQVKAETYTEVQSIYSLVHMVSMKKIQSYVESHQVLEKQIISVLLVLGQRRDYVIQWNTPNNSLTGTQIDILAQRSGVANPMICVKDKW